MTATARRELGAVVGGAVLAGALALIAGGGAWVGYTVERPAPLPPIEGTLSGADAAPLVPASGLVLLAAAVAVLAVRGWARLVLGVLVAAAGGVLTRSGLGALVTGVEPGDVGGWVGEVTVGGVTAWPVVAVLAGVLAVAVGVLVVLRGRTWPAMGRRYERATDPATGHTSATAPARPETDEDRAQAAWKALDRGEDPTA
ncbi:putative membrane protein (TIGR02234 family) [Blastococcus colisei]|uniref:Putative membrane protein (TIGR02234 family) n=1 Tax=Blastococcus colisei TaxID=1564162 RepID=A0A543PH02_9ACTN|nr:Trp biosynthesis-associated membrane protein [Blastococcus colisei]TQN43358.1 putative membrane protein (TIGR02234 family) [Blastococcus colisei]